MTKKKGKFSTFIFSLLPGAGEMYLGFMKQGISLMTAFFIIICLAGWLSIGPLLFVLPVMWFYSFFHVHNLNSLPDEEFYAVEDEYLYHFDTVFPKEKYLDGKMRVVAAAILIFIGISVLWNYLTDFLFWFLPYNLKEHLWSVIHSVPQIAIALVLIMVGGWLIRGKKRQLDDIDEKRDGGVL